MCASTGNRSYWVYILTNKRNGTLYVGVTNSLERRVWQHKARIIEGFTKQYGLNQLVHFEQFRWLRNRKLELIEKDNPEWTDLSAAWRDETLDSSLRSE